MFSKYLNVLEYILSLTLHCPSFKDNLKQPEQTTPSVAGDSCKNGWMIHPSSGSCYVENIKSPPTSWSQANDNCNSQGASLPSPDSKILAQCKTLCIYNVYAFTA